MAHSLALDIRERVTAFLAGESSLLVLQGWLVGATWNVEERSDTTAVDLTYDIKLALAEHSRGDISLAQCRQRLRDLITSPVIAASPSA
jgi:hypothetical protein